MAHDDIPEDRVASFPCNCGGSITERPDHRWECGECGWVSAVYPVKAKCPTCGGNDADAPCAYPSEGKNGCLRDARLK